MKIEKVYKVLDDFNYPIREFSKKDHAIDFLIEEMIDKEVKKVYKHFEEKENVKKISDEIYAKVNLNEEYYNSKLNELPENVRS